MPLNILIVDDHPMTVDSYVNLLSDEGFTNVEPFFIKSYNCETAYKEILSLKKQNIKIDFAIFDVSLPPYLQQNISNGIDLAALIKEVHPTCKILLLTMHTEAFMVNKIVKEIQPEGFISKSEVNFESFPAICKDILSGKAVYSNEIQKSQKKLELRNFEWGEYDSQILTLLSQGVKMIDIPNHIPLSLSSVEKRKAIIKTHFLLEKGGDIELISKVKQLGFL